MNNVKETTTATNVATKEWQGNFADLRENGEATPVLTQVECPIFIIFAEYFGYVSKFTKMCEDWCDGRVPDVHVQKFLMIEAASIFRQMKIDYGIEDIRSYYNRYYPLILEEYCDKLANIISTKA